MAVIRAAAVLQGISPQQYVQNTASALAEELASALLKKTMNNRCISLPSKAAASSVGCPASEPADDVEFISKPTEDTPAPTGGIFGYPEDIN